MCSAGVISHIHGIQNIFHVAGVLHLGSYIWPQPSCVKDGAIFDIIIVGAGTSGSIIANRLAHMNISVLLVEAGGEPPYETELTGYLPILKNTRFDWNLTSVCNEKMFSQKNRIPRLTQGKMLGGSASLNYVGYMRGNPYDFQRWAKITNDCSWSWENVVHLYKRSENVTDKTILNSPYRNIYGTNGTIQFKKQYNPATRKYFCALEETGYKYYLDLNPKHPYGYSNIFFEEGHHERQSAAYGNLGPIKLFSNFHILSNTLAAKIRFDKHKNAIGVKLILKNGKKIFVKARLEIIVSAGALKTPQLLMLSGIGPKKHLEQKNIKVIANLPVGQNLIDHVNGHLMYRTGDDILPKRPVHPYKFPYPILYGHIAINKSQDRPDYEVVGAVFNQDIKMRFLTVCAFVFNLENEVCDTMYEQSNGKEIFLAVITLLYPKSRGKILLRSKNPEDKPIIDPGYYKVHEDIENHAKYLVHFNRILNTTYFKSVDAKVLDPKLKRCAKFKQGTKQYRECFVQGMSAPSFYYTGTCGMGSVVDSRLRVKGVKKLRIADASIMPTTIGAFLQASVHVVAYKASDMIIEEHGLK